MKKMSKTERYQQGFIAYQHATQGQLATMPDAIKWMVSNGYIGLPIVDPVQVAAAELSQALRAETAIDADGVEYRVNFAVTKSDDDGGQQVFWGNEEFAPVLHKEMSLMQRREGIVNDVVRYYNDVTHHNNANPNRPYQPVLNFEDDVNERLMARKLAKVT